MKHLRLLLRYYWQLAFISLVLAAFLSFIPVRLVIAHLQNPQPEAILTLGGGEDREKFTAQFSKQHPTLEVWVSSGSDKLRAQKIFRTAEIPDQRVILDYRAVDTVTNFTSLVSELQQRNIHHVYLITSDFHMTRAKAIATIVLGSRGIAFTPVSVPSNQPTEPWYEVLRDAFRAIFWLLTGRTGASLNGRL